MVAYAITCKMKTNMVTNTYGSYYLGSNGMSYYSWAPLSNAYFFGSKEEAKMVWENVKSQLGPNYFPVMDPKSVKLCKVALTDSDTLKF